MRPRLQHAAVFQQAVGLQRGGQAGALLAPQLAQLAWSAWPSLSKCHGAPGLRIGWAITRDAALREAMVTAKFNTVISCSPLDEALALPLLRQPLAARRAALADNLAVTAGWVQREAGRIEWIRPEAGALCCVRLRSGVFDDAAVARFHAALPHHAVRVGRGPWFGESERVFRLGFGLQSPAGLREALQALSGALDEVLGAGG